MGKINPNASGCPGRAAGILYSSKSNQEDTPRVAYCDAVRILGEDRVLGPKCCPKKLWSALGPYPHADDIAIPIKEKCLKSMEGGGVNSHLNLYCIPVCLPVRVIARHYPRLFGDMQGLPDVRVGDGLNRPLGAPDWVWFAIPRLSMLNHQVGTIDVAKAVYADVISMRTTGTHLFRERVACRSGNTNPCPATIVFGPNGVISFPKEKARLGGLFYAYGVELQ